MTGRQPNILIAPGAFKECALDSAEIAEAIRRGVLFALPEANVSMLPMCDGGTGFSKRAYDFVQFSSKGKAQATRAQFEVLNAAGQPVSAAYTLIDYPARRVAVVESASVVGLALLDDATRQATPLKKRTSFGLGVLLRHILETNRPDRLYIGTGDSAVNDAGVGIGQALGLVALFDADGHEFTEPVTPELLQQVARVEARENPELQMPKNTFLACNPSSVLCGPGGTSRRYGPQKQAFRNAGLEASACAEERAEEIDQLEQALEHWARLVQGRYGIQLQHLPGAGGAGGVAAGVHLFLKANIRFSLDALRHLVPFEKAVEGKDLVISGEGAVDRNTGTGKVCYGLGLWGKKAGSEVAVLAGQVRPGAENLYARCIDDIHCIHGEAGAHSFEELLQPEITAEGLVLAAQRAVTRFSNMPKRGPRVRDSKCNKMAPRAFLLCSPDLMFSHHMGCLAQTEAKVLEILRDTVPGSDEGEAWYRQLCMKPVVSERDYGMRIRRAIKNLGLDHQGACQVEGRVLAVWKTAARDIASCTEDAIEFLRLCALEEIHVTVGHANHPLAAKMLRIVKKCVPAAAERLIPLATTQPPYCLPDPRYLEWAFNETGLSRTRTIVVGTSIADDLLSATVLRSGTALIDPRCERSVYGEAYPFCAITNRLDFLAEHIDDLFKQLRRRQGAHE